MGQAKTDDVVVFKKRLADYKKQIDADISDYSKQVKIATLRDYGPYSRVATDAYLDILSRGGKRIRGALVLLGYEMSGGTNKAMIIQVARAVEMIHAYVLIVDDITDRSDVRRGNQTAHIMLAEYYKKNSFGGDAKHFGESVAMTSSLLGAHAAQMIMANLDASEDLRLNAISILNRGLLVTVHGQFNDIFNQVIDDVTEKDVDNVTQWKTAHYTFLNPLHIGMILAGADCHDTDAITEYAMQVGSAFQITDDILGTFGGEYEVGKSPMDDMREGKRTIMTVYALEHTEHADKNFLIQMLGNQRITKAEFHRCQDIFTESGALEYAQSKAKQHVDAALGELDKESKHWSPEGVEFLRGLAQSLLDRTN